MPEAYMQIEELEKKYKQIGDFKELPSAL